MNNRTMRLSIAMLVCAAWLSPACGFTQRPASRRSTSLCLASSRENEIRRKIMKLKRQGRLKDASPTDASDMSMYTQKIKDKLGAKKTKMLGISEGDDGDDADDELQRIQAELDSDNDIDNDIDNDDSDSIGANDGLRGTLGTLPNPLPEQEQPIINTANAGIDVADPQSAPTETSAETSKATRKPIIDPSLFDSPDTDNNNNDDNGGKSELSDDELVDLVAKKLAERAAEKADQPPVTTTTLISPSSTPATTTTTQTTTATATADSSNKNTKLTSGVGGKWIKNDDADDKNSTEYYKPKTGSWGAFPRPKDISKAYGGGRRVGPGYSNEDSEASELRTKQLLQNYREKVGIDVPSEKEHATQIEEAVQIGHLAMQRGVYATAVSVLEKVTPWCSTNSPVGSKVFLDLAMAYEAVGRTKEAFQVYSTLTKSRNEDVKYNARKLLYGLEAMEVMRDISDDFSRQKIRNTFIDTTGLATISQNFDDVYNTAYVDTSGSFYKRLTESVVRSNREARQILLKATGKGAVPRLRVVQALRSISRHFDEALEAEKVAQQPELEPTAVIDGVPIRPSQPENILPTNPLYSSDEFNLATSEQMLANLDGSWDLQLLADKKGDGVSYYNTTDTTQIISVQHMTCQASCVTNGLFGNIEQQASLRYDASDRIVTPVNAKSTQNALASLWNFGNGFATSVQNAQQIMSVDSVLLITRRTQRETERDYFTVWRRRDENGDV